MLTVKHKQRKKSQMKTENAKNNTATANKKGKAGRPKYQPVVPAGKFTFQELEIANGVDPKTGRGTKCTALTLRKFLARDAQRRNMSEFVVLKGVLESPNSERGLGRKQLVYARRSEAKQFLANVETPKAKKTTPKKAIIAPVVSVTTPEPVKETEQVAA